MQPGRSVMFSEPMISPSEFIELRGHLNRYEELRLSCDDVDMIEALEDAIAYCKRRLRTWDAHGEFAH